MTLRSIFLDEHVKRPIYRIYTKYWDALSTYYTGFKFLNSPFYYLLMCLKYCCKYGKNPDQMQHFVASDLVLRCLQRPICPNTQGY